MTLVEFVTSHAVFLGLVMARVGGFVSVSPFPGNYVTQQTRVGLVVALSMLVALSVAPSSALAGPGLGLGPLTVATTTELGCGLVIGFAFRVILSAADVAAALFAQGVGLSAPSILNPTVGATDTVLGTIFGLFSVLLSLTTGLHRVALAYVLESFRAIPAGTVHDVSAVLPQLTELAGASLAVGVSLALPVAAVALGLQLALALVSRAAPSLQLFSIGFTILLGAGLTTLAASLTDIVARMLDHFGTLAGRLDSLLVPMGSP